MWIINGYLIVINGMLMEGLDFAYHGDSGVAHLVGTI
jgi:hypothetical protein